MDETGDPSATSLITLPDSGSSKSYSEAARNSVGEPAANISEVVRRKQPFVVPWNRVEVVARELLEQSSGLGRLAGL